MITDYDRDMLAHAFTLAKKGQYTASPNPCVGCVISDGENMAEGWHRFAGENHAEIIALNNAKSQSINLACATLYVSLEPCRHHGKTPPCTKAIIDAGIKRLVYGMQDPNPAVAGRGIEELSAAGIEVLGPLMPDAAAELNQAFFHKMQQGKPKIVAKVAMSFDGRTAMASGESQWITAQSARQYVQQIRAASCAILTGIGTVNADNPQLTVRDERFRVAEKYRQPQRIIVDSKLRINETAEILNTLPVIIAYCHGDPSKVQRLTERQHHLIKIAENNGQVDLIDLVDRLSAFKFNQLMIEAGPTLLGAMLALNLVDELYSFVAPTLLGSDAMPMAKQSIALLQNQQRMQLLSHAMVGQDMLFHFDLKSAK